MARGGPRPGAGRKKGGASKLDAKAREQALATGESPLDFLLATMRDVGIDFKDRLDAAKAAAPYVHAKLAAVDMKHSGGLDLVHSSKEQRDAAVAAAVRADR